MAVMALLISFLLPAIRDSLDAARAAKCRSNLRTISGLVTLYASDHGEYLRDGILADGTVYNWLRMLGPYLGYPTNTPGVTIENSEATFECPVARGRFPKSGTAYIRTYGLSLGFTFQAFTESILPIAPSSVQSPARVALIMDGNLLDSRPMWEVRATPAHFRDPVNKAKNMIHKSESIHVLFVDGHVEARGDQQIPDGYGIPSDRDYPFWDPISK